MAVEFKFTPVGTDEVLRELRAIREELAGTKQEVKETGEAAEASGINWDSLATRMTGLKAGFDTVVGVAGRVAGAISSVSQEIERQANILNNFGGNISNASDRMNGLVSRLDLMQASNRAAAAGLDLTGKQFGNLAVAAEKLADVTGGSTVDAMNALAQAVATGEAGPLKLLGISLDGISGKAEKQQEALRQLEEQFGNTEASADTLAEGLSQQLRVAMEDATTDFVEGLNASRDMTGSFNELAEAVTGVGQAFGLVGGESGGLSVFKQMGATTAAMIEGLMQRTSALLRAVTAMSQGKFQEAIDHLTVTFRDFDAEVAMTQENMARTAAGMGVGGAVAGPGGGGDGGRRGGGGRAANDNGEPGAFDEEGARQLGFARGSGSGFTFQQAQTESVDPSQFGEADDKAKELGKTIDGHKESQDGFNESLGETNAQYAQMGQHLTDVANGALNIAVAMQKGGNFRKLFADWAKGFALQQTGSAIGQFAAAAAAAASQNYQAVPQHIAAGGLHLAAAAAVGVLGAAAGAGGGRDAAGRAGAGGGRGGGGARPETPTGSRGGGSGDGGPKTIVVNFNSPMPEQEIGRATTRASLEARRRFGEAA